MSARSGALIIEEITRKRELLICAATGNSPAGAYATLAGACRTDPDLFAELRLIKLDEWSGLSDRDPGSCEHYLKHHLVEPLAIAPERYVAFAPGALDPAAECDRVRSELAHDGPIDLCILGLGVNGHIGFNEPGPALIPYCHVARLSEESRRHAMVASMRDRPRQGLTLGMQEILASRRILLLVTGSGKERVLAELLSGRVSTAVPASFLWLHGHTDCLIDRQATANPAS